MRSEHLALAVQHLRADGVVAAATESSFGLFANARSPRALDRLFAIKPREAAKGVGLVVPDVRCWEALVKTVPLQARKAVNEFWPGGLTVVLSAAKEIDPRLCAGGTIGVRQPGPSAAADLAASFGGALTATSANLAGEPPCNNDQEVYAAFPDELRLGDLVVIPGVASGGAVSTLLAPLGSGYQVLRPGAISEERLARCLSPARS